jgi:alpha-mannosidase
MKTVHLVGNAHMDPVWLWKKSDGIDAVLATARSACDRLDEYPEFIFTCSASWFHQVIEDHDPALFARVREAVRAGRWQLVGGMVIQPDCNLPCPESFARQLATGQAWYERAFGRRTTVGYNVDSFGHTAYLPRFLRDAGIDSYVFMRPGPHEKALPASLFRWRSPDGHEVAAFRITGAYCTGAPDIKAHVNAALAAMPEGAEDTMCFFGVGDHGGGPTIGQIDWLLEHRGDWPGVRLVFSHPRAFFDAIAPRMKGLPIVTGELQHHAIGCYAVERRIKVAMRRAESRLLQAGQAAEALKGVRSLTDKAPLDRLGAGADPLASTLAQAWDDVLFNQFHDMLGGTCLSEASAAVAGLLTAAEARAEDALTLLTRRASRADAIPGEHRIVLFNPSPEPFDGYLVHEPWGPPDPLRLIDEAGRTIPCQIVEARGKVPWPKRILFRAALPPRARRILKLVRGDPAETVSGTFSLLGNTLPFSLDLGVDSIRLEHWTLTLDVVDDPSDTWSHSWVNRFGGRTLGTLTCRAPWEHVEQGPIRATMRNKAEFGQSRVWIRAAVTDGEGTLRLHLAVVWSQVRQLLRLRLAAPCGIEKRLDLVSGGPLERPLDGLEYPLSGALVVGGPDCSMAIAAPEVFSVAVDRGGASLTLLRSPFSSHHDPQPADERPDHHVTDQGWHEFDLVLKPSVPLDLAEPSRLAREMLMPPIVWDLTG